MSSFKRRTPIKVSSTNSSTVSEKPNSSQNLNPTSNVTADSQLLSGLSSIDDILGLNGLPRGHTLLFRTPDPHSAWGLMISRYALAQGLVAGDAVAVIAQEDDAKDLISGCMWTSDAIDAISADTDDVDPEMEPEGGVKIAWRYSKMKQFSTTVPKRGSHGGVDQESATFDLTLRIPASVVSHSQNVGQLVTIPIPQNQPSKVSACDSVLESVYKLTRELNNPITDGSARRAIRIVIPDLGSSSWGDLQPTQLIRFLHALRGLLRGTSAAAFITLSSTLSDDNWGGPGWAGKLSHISDGCITLAGFGDDPTASLSFPTHHGLVRISSSPSPGMLRAPSISRSILRGMTSSGPHGGGENNLAFRCTRRRLVIETMHLGAEGGVGARQTTAPTDINVQPESTPINYTHPTVPGESARVSISLDSVASNSTDASQPVQGSSKAEKNAKPKARRVVFQSDKPEIYDF
ncbi:hypothetical protein BDV93DRAFT_525485 [Ceratobasidium sp. AG-I]|nr:hypothetical protein BDV93DRAFT_525485 [Ceratobasidium sp. AG-I]